MTLQTTEADQDDLEALQDLVQSKGWALWTAYVHDEINGAAMRRHIRSALNESDPALSLDKLRQMQVLEDAAERWMRWPKERVSQLQQKGRSTEFALHDSRRPMGL